MRTGGVGLRVGIAALIVAAVWGACGAALAQDPNVAVPSAQAVGGPLPEDGPAYPVSVFILQYVRENPGHPPIEELGALPIELGQTSKGYVAPRADVPPVTITLDEAAGLGGGTQTYYGSALQRILESLRDHLTQQHLLGVYVAPDPLQISDTGQDLRKPQPPNGRNPLTLTITTGVVTEVRTLASGERVSDKGPIKPEDRTNNPKHKRILDNSPIKPHVVVGAEGEEEGEEQQTDLLRQDTLDRYLFHLSRHPGRRVDASVAAAAEPGGVILDYQVTENRPLTVYAQFSNTGTRSTDDWRERFGFFHSQLTNHDDILSFDYTTAWFDKTNAVNAAYEAPFGNDRIRWRIYGNWAEFTADEVGFFNDDFTGESWAIGGEIVANIYQKRELFIDAFAGARFENIQVDNTGLLINGDEDFIVPVVGLRLDRRTEWFSTQASLQLEWWLSDANTDELARLGRTDPDEDPTVLQGGLTHSVYLEPIFNRKGWEDLSTPKDSTLAHELLASVRGQYAFGNRLIPQAEQVAGGLYTVRGYPESVVAGDDIVIGTIEYRLHVPRLFNLNPEPGKLMGRDFRWAPQYVFGPVDWDLIPKAFFDIGRTWNSDRLSFETDETLMSAGIGIELLYKRNLNVRLDWGFVLEGLDSVNVDEGSNRLHFVATILF